MNAKDIWKASETRSVVWRPIHAAGEAGIGRTELMDKSGKSSTAVDWHLTNMARDRHIRRPEGSKASRWVAGPNRPPIEGLVLALALEALEDCPAGVSEKLLCANIGCSWKELGAALVPAELAGRVERMVMPAQHGGCVGWCLPGMGAAAAAQTEGYELPVVEVDIDRIHRAHRPDLFDAHVQDGCLSITSGALTMHLSPDHTERLLTYLLGEVPI